MLDVLREILNLLDSLPYIPWNRHSLAEMQAGTSVDPDPDQEHPPVDIDEVPVSRAVELRIPAPCTNTMHARTANNVVSLAELVRDCAGGGSLLGAVRQSANLPCNPACPFGRRHGQWAAQGVVRHDDGPLFANDTHQSIDDSDRAALHVPKAAQRAVDLHHGTCTETELSETPFDIFSAESLHVSCGFWGCIRNAIR